MKLCVCVPGLPKLKNAAFIREIFHSSCARARGVWAPGSKNIRVP